MYGESSIVLFHSGTQAGVYNNTDQLADHSRYVIPTARPYIVLTKPDVRNDIFVPSPSHDARLPQSDADTWFLYSFSLLVLKLSSKSHAKHHIKNY